MNAIMKPGLCKTALHVLAGFAIWLGCQLLSGVSSLFSQPVVSIVVSSGIQIVFTYWFLFLYCKKILHISMADCRIKLSLASPAWWACAILLPVLVSLWFVVFVPGEFSFNRLNSAQLLQRVVTAVLATCITASITEEMVFRGFVMRIIEAKGGRVCAILIPSVAFAAFHLIGISPGFSGFVQLMVAGTSVGIMFSLICYQSGSVCPGIVVHGIWNLVMLGGIVDIGTSHSGTSILNYTIATDSRLLTGGAFGIEASLPALVGYWCVIAFLLLRQSKALRKGKGASALPQ